MFWGSQRGARGVWVVGTSIRPLHGAPLTSVLADGLVDEGQK